MTFDPTEALRLEAEAEEITREAHLMRREVTRVFAERGEAEAVAALRKDKRFQQRKEDLVFRSERLSEGSMAWCHAEKTAGYGRYDFVEAADSGPFNDGEELAERVKHVLVRSGTLYQVLTGLP